MKTANEKIRDSLIQHSVHLSQYANGLTKESIQPIIETEKKLNHILTVYALRAGKRKTRARKQELYKALRNDVKNLRNEAWKEVTGVVGKNIKSLAKNEALFQIKNFERHLPFKLDLKLPRGAELSLKAMEAPIEGATLRQWLLKAKQNDTDGIVGGFIKAQKNNLGIDATVSFAMDKAKRSVMQQEALVLTSVNNTHGIVRQAINEENPWLVTKEIFSATLDSRTTMNCMALDGKVFKLTEGPVPPIHFRCRSIRLPHVTEESVSSRPFDPSTEKTLVKEYSRSNNMSITTKRSNLPHGEKGKFDQFARKRRRELIGKVPDKTTYQEWLKKQSKDFQEEVLGKRRAEAFRSGKVTLNKFVDFKGNTLTLKQLEKRGFLSLEDQ